MLSLVLRFKSSSSLSNSDNRYILMDFSLDLRISNGGNGVANMLSRFYGLAISFTALPLLSAWSISDISAYGSSLKRLTTFISSRESSLIGSSDSSVRRVACFISKPSSVISNWFGVVSIVLSSSFDFSISEAREAERSIGIITLSLLLLDELSDYDDSSKEESASFTGSTTRLREIKDELSFSIRACLTCCRL